MANLNVIELQAQPLAAPIPGGLPSFAVRALAAAMTAALGGALALFGLLLAVLAVPLAPIAVVWVLARQQQADRPLTLRPAGTFGR